MPEEDEFRAPSVKTASSAVSSLLMPINKTLNRDAVHFGTVVNRLRMERSLTLGELAKRTGMNPTHLGVLERGGNMPSLVTILRLALALDLEAADLVREVDHSYRQRLQREAAFDAARKQNRD